MIPERLASNDASSQWLSVRTLTMAHCIFYADVKLHQWRRLCPEVEELLIGDEDCDGTHAVYLDGIDSPWQSLKTVRLDCPLAQRERNLTLEEARKAVRKICPSAKMGVYGTEVSQCREFPHNHHVSQWDLS